ncbi:hypothetical protein [Bryobacter aggregatus]|uniref:hypothetical protein n=1 Tax=Bryobacter aggregatus TaxID=360054 RepID=UPI0004E0BF90|nr:hypothetical protein [Bryobacter aggregatus]
MEQDKIQLARPEDEMQKLGMQRGVIQNSLYRTRRANRIGWILFATLILSLVGSVLAGVRSLN